MSYGAFLILVCLSVLPVYALYLWRARRLGVPLRSWGTVVGLVAVAAPLALGPVLKRLAMRRVIPAEVYQYSFLVGIVVVIVGWVITELVVGALTDESRKRLREHAAAQEAGAAEEAARIQAVYDEMVSLSSYVQEDQIIFNQHCQLLHDRGIHHVVRAGLITSILVREEDLPAAQRALDGREEPSPQDPPSPATAVPPADGNPYGYRDEGAAAAEEEA